MKSVVSSIIVVLALMLCPVRFGMAVPPPDSPVALVSKVVLDVALKESGKEWQQAKRGEMLVSGDKVKTGEKSLAIIKFKDNSFLRVRENTELSVTGEMKGNSFSKSVDVRSGAVGFNIQKQEEDEEFRFSSPTSVASIRGTGGLFSALDTVDVLTVIDGNVSLMNTRSRSNLDVSAGFTAFSGYSGTIVKRESTTEERTAAENAAKATTQKKRLEIPLEGRGNQKTLYIEYEE